MSMLLIYCVNGMQRNDLSLSLKIWDCCGYIPATHIRILGETCNQGANPRDQEALQGCSQALFSGLSDLGRLS